MQALEEKLYSVLSGDATLASYADGGVWRDFAPQDTAGTVVIFSLTSAPDSYTLASRAFTEFTYTIKAVSPSRSAATAHSAAARVDALLNDAALTLSEGSAMACRRTQAISMQEPDKGETWQHVGGLYLIYAQE